ncbi:D-threonine aldolase-like [Sycon ciliatum]|uniref:D-threonine aldolase-like n=1 Tax=Sycon ciliatum TaxID=27933 RepID=UPI0020AACEFA|eukprot:scpid58493/ scgid24549/ D-threonine aldolase
MLLGLQRRFFHQAAVMAQSPRKYFAKDSSVAYTDVAGCLSKDALEGIDTPALLVDRAALNHNLALLEKCMAKFPGIMVRPHGKAHKSGQMAQLQAQSHSAFSGICAQKVTEAETFAKLGGVKDVYVSNEIVSRKKLEHLAELASLPEVRIRLCVDNADNVRDISSIAASANVVFGVVIDVDVGQKRCGVSSPSEALQLAELIRSLPGVRFDGIQAYHGLLQHIRVQTDRKEAVSSIAAQAKEVVDVLKAAGIDCEVVTGGGTGTFYLEAETGVYNEVQPGSYIFMDAAYGRDEWNLPISGESWRHSLYVLTTVVSRNEERRLAVTDSGTKAISLDMGPPLVHVSGMQGCSVATFSSGGDEHGLVYMDEGSAVPAVGSVLTLVPGHCDPAVNMYDKMIIVNTDDGTVEDTWPISARGPGH